MQVPIVNGIYTDANADFRTAYPRNMIPVPKEQGISKGYLRPADGIVQLDTAPGADRGGIRWNNICYRVMGDKFVTVNAGGVVNEISFIGGSSQVTMDYSFDYLAIASEGGLYLYDGGTLTQVTDADLGTVLDVLYVDGYFMTTDGVNIVVTELNNPFAVNPLKYGSSEADPDPIAALLKVKNEPYVVNRHTIEVFDNIGGSTFPFQRIEGAQIQKGAIGTHACCKFKDAVAFVGGGRNEALAIWIALNGQLIKVSTREIDQLLATYTETNLASSCLLETRIDSGHEQLYIHLPNQTVVYDANASEAIGQPVWFELTSTASGTGQYYARNFVRCYDKWIVGHPTLGLVGYLTNTLATHWGETIGWEFSTPIVYNQSQSALFHELELVCLTGRVDVDDDPTVWTQYSLDGMAWSMPIPVKAGMQGERLKRIRWLKQGMMRNWRIQKFIGTSETFISVAMLNARLEGMKF